MAKRGRKSTFNSKIQETILRLVKDNKDDDQIAEVIGVCRKTLSNWKGKHPELLHAVRESKQAADELVEASLFSRAVGYSHPAEKIMVSKEHGVIREPYVEHYPPDTTAAMFWLRNRQPKKWREKTEGDVTVNNILPKEEITDEQLEARLAKLLSDREKKGKKNA